MKCLKCGRETDQTFCQACREEMEKYPVKPGTIVLLPKERPSGKKTPQPPSGGSAGSHHAEPQTRAPGGGWCAAGSA